MCGRIEGLSSIPLDPAWSFRGRWVPNLCKLDPLADVINHCLGRNCVCLINGGFFTYSLLVFVFATSSLQICKPPTADEMFKINYV